MSKQKVYADGIKVFTPHENAPDFVKGTVIITPETLTAWMKENMEYFTDYKGKQQLRLSLLEGSNGLYMAVDTYKPEPKEEAPSGDLPF